MLSGDRDAVSSVVVDASMARQMSDMIRAFRIRQIVGTIAQLGIPDRLASGARTAGELASLIGSHAGATHRLMRAASDQPQQVACHLYDPAHMPAPPTLADMAARFEAASEGKAVS